MKRILLTILMGIFLISLVSGMIICIDLDPPSLLNSSLTLTATNNNINLNWIAATDSPNCSGIDYYDIYRSTNGVNFSLIVNTSDTTYTDTFLSYGNTYYYMIHVFDLAGHNEGGEALSNSLYLSPPSGPTPSGGGGGGGGSSSYWKCGEWGDCIDGTQTRTCENVNGLRADRVETRGCVPEFILTGQEPEENETVTTTPPGFFATITGAAIGTLGNAGSIVALIFILVIISGVIFILIKTKKIR